jgi:NADPH:quinone reductase-like Zn-dependent oxidoreductase
MRAFILLVSRPYMRLQSLALLALFTCAWSTAVAAEDTMRRYEIQRDAAGSQLVMKQVARPKPGAGEVLMRVRAVSLNRRDLYVLAGTYGRSGSATTVPISDGAGEVVAVGAGVSRFKVGDRVVGTFFTKWIDGKPTQAGLSSARGGDAPGMLSEFVVADEDSLVKFPEHLSFEEAATLPCAAVTVWNALFSKGHLQRGDYVLLEGTGGVSIFGLQFAVAAGAKPIITSSSDSKLERAKALGAAGTINYRTHPDWENEVRKLTHGKGVDHVLEVGGKDTLTKAVASIALGGHIALIGGLSGFDGTLPVGAIMLPSVTVRGIYVGSRADFEAMNEFIAQHKLKPVVDRVFPFEQATNAFKYMDSGSHFGKVVVTL